jgi:hypothetical protein
MSANRGSTDSFGNAILAARDQLYFVVEKDDGTAPANPGRNPHPGTQDSAIRLGSHAGGHLSGTANGRCRRPLALRRRTAAGAMGSAGKARIHVRIGHRSGAPSPPPGWRLYMSAL